MSLPALSPGRAVHESPADTVPAYDPKRTPAMRPPNDQPPADGPLSEDLAQLNDWQDALAAMGQPEPCDAEDVEGPTDDEDDARSAP